MYPVHLISFISRNSKGKYERRQAKHNIAAHRVAASPFS
jgi:hypothetical protein